MQIKYFNMLIFSKHEDLKSIREKFTFQWRNDQITSKEFKEQKIQMAFNMNAS